MKKCDPIVSVLRRFRENRKISQGEMSKRTGIPLRTLQRVESGESDMNLSHYRKYLKVLEVADMDVSIALHSHEFATELDVAAVARMLPPDIKKLHLQYMLGLVKLVQNQEKK
ncbi:helix-turn-helix domain-containing protein [Vibrio hepatarius]|jgi:predicted transcriptional regulator|uniref:helix-turn-helix domain-containing protein n=1 Tax=Vibrio hepatarius TaxID=171383 RepID=UPI00148E246A|nr:helix-turn-helix transcriptional regulator [Vibrio hepatarius]NOI16418.1 helix-turn-helix transcriptional regulator [Vibrio hepatarius]